MSREIKYRAWLKEEEKMVNVETMDFTDKSMQYLEKNEIIDAYLLRRMIFEDIELMQYTGIKNKNGLEIYEGDIIICKYGPEIMMEVKWVDEGFRTLGKYNGDNYVGYVKNSAEVIGNIYENPELLGEENEV
jgi:hypothetical protein